MKAKKFLTILLCLMMVLSLAACSKGGSGETSTQGDQTSQSTDSNKNAVGVIEEDTTGKVNASGETTTESTVIAEEFNIGMNMSPTSLNPWQGKNGEIMPIIYQTFAQLTYGSDEYQYQTMKSYTQVDEKTFDIEIYDYIKDANGNPLTADDVVWCFDQAVGGGFVPSLSNLESWEKLNDTTIRFKFKTTPTYKDFPNLLTGVKLVTRASYEASEDEMATTPVGTGHYKVTEFTAGYRITIERVEDYWQTDESLIADYDKANVKTINFYIITESAQMAIALENGTIDFSRNVSNKDVVEFQDGGKYDDDFWTYVCHKSVTFDLLLNASEESLCNNINLRNAILYAVDSDACAKKLEGVSTHDISNTNFSDYNPAWENEDNYYNTNLDKAKEYFDAYLKETGKKAEDVQLTILCQSGMNMPDAAVIIQACLEQLGMPAITINPVQATVENTYLAEKGDWDLYIASGGANFYVVDAYNACFHDSQTKWEGNKIHIEDEKLQELINTCLVTETHTQENVDALHNYVIEMAYGKSLAQPVYSTVSANWIESLYFSHNLTLVPGACTFGTK